MRCGMLLEKARSSTIKAVKLAIEVSKKEQKDTAALDQALQLLTSRLQAAGGASDADEPKGKEADENEEKEPEKPEEEEPEEPEEQA